MIRSYDQMIQLAKYEERFDYLKLWDTPHVPPDDVIYRQFLKSTQWIKLREDIIDRDLVQDLAVVGRFAEEQVIVHHINPVTTEDILNMRVDILLNPNNLVTTTISTHNAIHYKPIDRPPVVTERFPGDTTLW